MAFRLPKKAGEWFKHLQGEKNSGFEYDFDSYYFCLIAGLATSKKDTALSNSSTVEIIQHFPKEYLTSRYQIIALFLNTELKNLGISLTERTALDQELRKLINPISTTGLSDEGMKKMNQYAYGGFRELQEYFSSQPRVLDVFLVGFYRFIQSNHKNHSDGKV